MRIAEHQLRQVIRAVLQENRNQTLTPEFKRWFGRSMLVDPAGNPIKLYHGTRRSFNVFNLSEFGNYGPGIYLTASSANAAGFASGRHQDPNATGGGSVMPLYVRLVNPLIIVEAPSAAPQIRTISGELTPGHEALQEKLSTLDAAVEYMGGRGGKEFSREVRSLGHDGLIVDFTGLMTDPADMAASGITKEELTMGEVIVFDPRQVKSALGNPGTYDPDDPNIVSEARSMRITGQKLRQIIREEILSEARKPPVETFMRFGDPRAVKGGVSVIHDPHAYAYAEEPALYGHDAEDTRTLRSEAGISAYPVVGTEGDVIIFRVGNGVGPFSRQLGNFLLDRLMADDAYVFKARRVPSMALGTDDEPLIDAATVKSVRQVPATRLRVTERGPERSERLLDLLDPWDLNGYLDMGYNEFFKTRNVAREKITQFLAGLAEKFTTSRQRRVIAEIEEAWLSGWDEDHST